MKKFTQILLTLTFALIIGGFSLSHLLLSDKDISEWERRKLQTFPEISVSSLMNGSFMKSFETYLTDHFPLRDSLRTLKARFHFDVLMQKDNNKIYIVDGSASKLDEKIVSASVSHFTKRINEIYNTYLKSTNSKIIFALVPEKNFYLNEGTSYPGYSFYKMYDKVSEALPERFFQLDIFSYLSKDSYYKTDSHWRQEEIVPVADLIREKLGLEKSGTFEKKDAGDFYGVYYGQSALPLKADKLYYLTNDETENATVTSIEKEGETKVYDLEKLTSSDKYNIFLSGPVSVLEVNNPKGDKNKELIIFRDSFGSSLAPLLIPGYSKVTLIDTRYITPDFIDDYVTFKSQDILFLYSTAIVNNSSTLKAASSQGDPISRR